MRYLIICLALICSSCSALSAYKNPAIRDMLGEAETVAAEIIDPAYHPQPEAQPMNPTLVFVIGGGVSLSILATGIYLNNALTLLANKPSESPTNSAV